MIMIVAPVLFFLALLLISLYSISLDFLWGRKDITTAGSAVCGNKQLPPGSSGWPFIGETIEFYRAGLAGAPEKFFFDRFRKYSSQVFRTSLIGETVIVIGGTASGNKFLFSNEGEDKLINAWYPPSVRKLLPVSNQFSKDQDFLKAARKAFPKFLSQEAVKTYVGTMDSMTRRHFETHWDKYMSTNEEMITITVHPLVKNYSFQMACRLLLSMDLEQETHSIDELQKLFSVLLDGILSIPIDFPGTAFNRAIKASKLIKKQIAIMIKLRKLRLLSHENTPTRDVLSLMIMFFDENSSKFMEETFITDIILGLIIAGHDSTTSTLTMVVKYLVEFPKVYDQVLVEQSEIAKSKATDELLNWSDIQKMKYSWNVVCEVLRLATPAPGGFKQAMADFTYAGYHIPKGCKLYWSSMATHKNPDNFPDPEKFYPSRFEGGGPAPFTYVPFARGPGTCPGKEYARVQMLVFVHNLVRRYKLEKSFPLNPEDEEKLIFKPFPTLTGGLPIRIRAH
ncbi:beta-amyrin 28-monooxygenase-like [Papaver somniferum]|uniref:beta-amyrin 28-monooxygenase-like n=1 Tax=Papaver somniferum TaxID=3469 RepID=UPI000E6FE198|nr:beta-amyrin 28-monooxygenase-like [Papaver somniferum]